MKVIAMYFKTSYPPGAIFSTLYFLRNFQISWSVSLLEAGMACQGQTLELLLDPFLTYKENEVL
jgi:hypothetical protein